jgi:Co/Zn/Cd efflux system component
MDCPAEERLIRLKLDGNYSIVNLDFEIADRRLIVYHKGNVTEIEKSIADLNLSSKLIANDEVTDVENSSEKNDRKLLWIVLLINFGFFLVEMVSGILAESMGLIADSLDMLADALVYGLSLFAIGGTIFLKKRIAKLSGYFQIMLALIGFGEVIRRYLGIDSPPEFQTMIIVSFLALIGNSVSLFILQKSKNTEAHIQASKIFTSNDVIINIGVIIAAVAVYLLESNKPDLIIGSIVFVIVIIGARRILQLSK